MPNPTRKSLGNRLPKIIHRPDLQSRRQRGMLAVITALGWLAWLYLFLPLATVGGWIFGVERFQDYVVDSHDQAWDAMMIYAICVVLAGSALLIWAFYNYRRFRNVERRQPVAALTNERLALSYGIHADEVAYLKNTRHAMIEHDEHGNILSVAPAEKR